jgi:hypothetical protein
VAFLARCDYENDLEESGYELPPAPGDFRTPEMVALVNAGISARVHLRIRHPLHWPVWLPFSISLFRKLPNVTANCRSMARKK